MQLLRTFFLLLVGLFPASAVKNWLLNGLGNQINPTAEIDPVILFRIGRIEVGAGSHVMSVNRFRNLDRVLIGAGVTVMRFNTFWALTELGAATSAEPASMGVLSIDDYAVINKGHSFDCSGGFFLGAWSGIGGRQVMVSTHSYDPRKRTLTCAPTRVGVNSMVAARTTLAMGATVPDYCVLALGAVLLPGMTKTHTMYGGVPAKPIRDVSHWKAMNDRTGQRPTLRD